MSDDDATKHQKNKVEKNDEKADERKEKRLVKVAIDSLSLRVLISYLLLNPLKQTRKKPNENQSVKKRKLFTC